MVALNRPKNQVSDRELVGSPAARAPSPGPIPAGEIAHRPAPPIATHAVPTSTAAVETLRGSPRQFLRVVQVIFVIEIGFTIFLGASASAGGDLALGLAAGVNAFGALAAAGSWRLLRLGRALPAVWLTWSSILVVALVLVAVPPATPALAALPLLGATLALEYHDGRAVRWMMSLSWLASVAAAVIVETVPTAGSQAWWFYPAARVTTFAAVIGLTIVVLTHYSARIRDSLAESEAARVTAETAIEALAASEGQLGRLAERSPDVIYRIRVAPTLAFEYISAAVEAVSGYRAEEFLADPSLLRRVAHPNDLAIFDAAMAGEVAADRPIIQRWITLDGRTRWLEHHNTVLRDERGRIVAIEGIARDVTQVREMEAALDIEARERSAIGAGLQHLEPGGTPEATGKLICDELISLPGIDMAVIFTFPDDRSASIFAVAGEPLAVGQRIPTRWAARLHALATEGPWSAPWNPGADDSEFARQATAAGLQAFAFSPIGTHLSPVGVLAVATQSGEYARRLVEQLPAVVEFAASANALLGTDLVARRVTLEQRERLEALLRRREFEILFQPIVDMGTGMAVGYEALTRFDDLTRPDQVFAQARRAGVGRRLELLTLTAAVRAANALPPDAWISLNASPDFVIAGRRLGPLLATWPRQVVIEITEHESVSDYPALRQALAALGQRVRVAVDDAGSGIANFTHLVELRPDFIKIDAGLVRGIDTDLTRQALVAGLRYFARATRHFVIAEGIETAAERATLEGLGIRYGQGYLLGQPAPAETWAARPQAHPTAQGAPEVARRTASSGEAGASPE